MPHFLLLMLHMMEVHPCMTRFACHHFAYTTNINNTVSVSNILWNIAYPPTNIQLHCHINFLFIIFFCNYLCGSPLWMFYHRIVFIKTGVYHTFYCMHDWKTALMGVKCHKNLLWARLNVLCNSIETTLLSMDGNFRKWKYMLVILIY